MTAVILAQSSLLLKLLDTVSIARYIRIAIVNTRQPHRDVIVVCVPGSP